MEVTDTQRFPQRFTQVVIGLGALVMLFSLYRLTVVSSGLPLLLLALLTINVTSRVVVRAPFGKRDIPVVDAFIFLALFLFDGEPAALLAGAVTLCLSLRVTKSASLVLLKTALALITTFLVVWTLRLNMGTIAGFAQGGYSLALVNAVCLAIIVYAVVQASVVALGEAYKINQPVWRTWGANFLWSLATGAVSLLMGLVVARLVGIAGFGNFIAVAAALAIFYFGYRAYRTNPELCPAPEKALRRQASSSVESAERFRSAFDYSAIGMALVSSEGRWLQVNHSLCALLGYTESELLATDFLKVTHPDDLGAALANIRQLLKGQIPTYQMEKRYIHKSGHEVWVTWSVSLVREQHSNSVHLIFQIQDITNRKLAEQQLHHDAFHDALTGLPNRALFMDHLKLAIARSQRHSDQMFAVLYLDLDRFKIINDSLGHMIGDNLLIGIARRLEECLRPGDTVARLGGDEFTVLIEDINSEGEAITVAERIHKELAVPFNLSGREVFTTISIGIATSATVYERAEEILRDADTAMYRAKSLGKSRHEIFDKAMHARALNILQLETDLRRAVERQEFFLQYQPIVDLDGFKLRGFEALVRWRHPERGFISPIDFIPVAEETGMIAPIGEWVLREACTQMQRWQAIFPSDPPLSISVNLSGRQFTQNDLIQKVADILSETKILPNSLKLEITESVVMENIEMATGMLKELRALGVQLSIDDFGTCYSSLSYLHRFPIDTLKIDRSFVTDMSENNENTEIVRTIVMLAQNLGMDVVAEGVETNEQLALLRKLGCEYGQGYFFSKPVHTDGAEKIICDTYSVNAPEIFRVEPVQVPAKSVLVA